ncbi:MAG TPA: hypothetical protein VLA05_05345 [Coriobacteriia bacterium]|nr:hypothetical protein [Coriobacteriia bacterium]
MRRLVFAAALAALVFSSTAAPCLAATTKGYSVVLPRFGSAYYTSTKTVSAYRDYGVKHRYSGGKTVNFQVCDSQHNTVGPRVAIAPGRSDAPLVDLWYNGSASSKSVSVKMWTSLTTAVQVLAEGTWYWNY